MRHVNIKSSNHAQIPTRERGPMSSVVTARRGKFKRAMLSACTAMALALVPIVVTSTPASAATITDPLPTFTVVQPSWVCNTGIASIVNGYTNVPSAPAGTQWQAPTTVGSITHLIDGSYSATLEALGGDTFDLSLAGSGWTIDPAQPNLAVYSWSIVTPTKPSCSTSITPTVTYVPATCAAAGTVTGDTAAEYTWTQSGNAGNRVLTATATDPSYTLTQPVFGPYNLNRLGHMDPNCLPVLTITHTATATGVDVTVTLDNKSRWPRWPDATWDGDTKTPTDHGSGNTWNTFNVAAGAIGSKTWSFPTCYNGGSFQFHAQDILGAERDIDTARQTVTIQTGTNCGVTPVTIQQCVATNSHKFTSLSGWDLSQTRATGHVELVSNGLRTWTEGATTTDKAAGYYAVDFALADLGTGFRLESTAASGTTPPALQIVLQTGAILVYEPGAYGTNNVWSNQAVPGLSAGMGYTSFGSVDDILAANPTIRVVAIGFSLGSGVLGDHTITKIVAGCVEYTFGLPVTTPTTPTGSTGGGAGVDRLADTGPDTWLLGVAALLVMSGIGAMYMSRRRSVIVDAV